MARAEPPDARLCLREFRAKGRSNRVLAQVEGLSFRPSAITAIIGPNGAGKTSLLRGIAGLLPSSGSLQLRGLELGGLRASRRVAHLGYQPQGRPVAEGLRVQDFVAASLGAHTNWITGLTEMEHARVRKALGLARIDSLADRLLDTLSGGESSRVLLASTLVLDAEWLLLDEPAAFADAANAQLLYELFREVTASRSRSLVIVEHDLGRVRTYADDAVLMQAGRVVAQGPVADVFGDAALERVYGVEFAKVDVGGGHWAVVPVGEAGA